MLAAESLRGKKVIGVKGVLIGEVEGVEIDMKNWQVTNFRIHLSDDVAKQLGYRTGFMGMSKPTISLPIAAIDQVGDVITVKNEISELKDLEHAETKVASPPPPS